MNLQPARSTWELLFCHSHCNQSLKIRSFKNAHCSISKSHTLACIRERLAWKATQQEIKWLYFFYLADVALWLLAKVEHIGLTSLVVNLAGEHAVCLNPIGFQRIVCTKSDATYSRKKIYEMYHPNFSFMNSTNTSNSSLV